MSEKRYVCREDSRGDIYIHDGGEGFNFDIEKACEVLNRQNDIINSQAETIEVLREWLRAEDSLDSEKAIIKIFKDDDWQAPLMGEERHQLAKRRIAALEGK